MSARSKLVFLFAGQGSQYPGMGKRLFECHPVFRRWMETLDDVVLAESDVSVIRALFHDTPSTTPLADTTITHPAIFMLEYALAQTLIDAGVAPDLVVGASLGEVAAAAVAGMVDAEQALRFVVRQARVFDVNCPAGGMLAILDAPVGLSDDARWRSCEIAAINGPQHFVVAGPRPAISEYAAMLRARHVTAELLPVAHGFHSAVIEPARQPFGELAGELSLERGRIPLMSCSRADTLDMITADHFWDVVRQPIRLSDTIDMLLIDGDRVLVDLSPSGTLANLVAIRRPRPQSTTIFSVLNRLGDDETRLQAAVNALGSARTTTRETRVTKQAYVFPGQGSQMRGMGAGLFDHFPELVAKADAILGYSIRTLCLDDPDRRLSLTAYTQPAMFVLDVLTYLQRLREGAMLPDYLAGHSLGEYAALCAAGVFDFETGLRLVQRRGAAMSKATGGGMAAILGCPERTIASVLAGNGLAELDIANLNAPDQTVIAGPADALARARAPLERTGATVVPLNVSAPFHSRYMRDAARAFAAALVDVDFKAPKIAVIANVTARPYPADSAGIRDLLTRQLTAPVRWVASMAYLLANGVEEIAEIGPGMVLTNLVTSIRRAGVTLPDTPHEPSPAAPPTSCRTAGDDQPVPETLGATSFREAYGVNAAYVVGSMYMGIASTNLVVRLARRGYLGFFGTGGLTLARIEASIRTIASQLTNGEPFGMNLLCEPSDPGVELRTVRLFREHGVRNVEASGFMQITPALVMFRVKGLRPLASGAIAETHRIIAKVSHPDVARAFLEPCPEPLLAALVASGDLTRQEADLGRRVPVATDLCAEADSGGHTDRAVATTLIPTLVRLSRQIRASYGYKAPIHIGAAGGIGTPEAVAAAFLLGADFVLTGSINQCSVEAGTSDLVKDMLQKVNVQDTDYAPAGDMFEMGSKVRVMRRGVFFPARANKLYDLWKVRASIDDLDPGDRQVIQEKYFRRSFESVYADVQRYYGDRVPAQLDKAARDPKHKMALIFRTYFADSTRWALEGDEGNRVNFQVQCGPALGAFNQWMAGTALESWRERHVDEIADRMMQGAATVLGEQLNRFRTSGPSVSTRQPS